MGTKYNVDIQLAENGDIGEVKKEENEYEEKRKKLQNTKIVRQTWSILEIYQKNKDRKLILDPDYQRNSLWKNDKKSSFIESLYMGIMIPPIYVVEIPGEDFLSTNRYEVVDGKQRLTAIKDFLDGNLKLSEKSLEYYADIFADKNFEQINIEYSEKNSQLLSSILDIYVITANSPDFTKYDIFARLNKGAEPLKVNEIRRAVYRSSVTEYIEEFIKKYISDKDLKKEYENIFTKNKIKRFDDYGRFYRSVAFYIQSDISTKIVKDYNSRPREMINTVLQGFQKKNIIIQESELESVLNATIELLKLLKDNINKDYLIDACIPFIDRIEEVYGKIEEIQKDEDVLSTFDKSSSTTSNVNDRLKAVIAIMGDK